MTAQSTLMSRALIRVFTAIFAVMWLVYISPYGSYLCLGLMTHDLPAPIAPLLRGQFGAFALSFFGLPAAAFVHWQLKPSWGRFLWGVVVCLVLVSIFVWRPRSWPLRKQGVTRAATRMNTIHQAISDFHFRNGSYPVRLEELDVDSSTGMVSYPRVAYRRATSTFPFSGYQLKVETGFGILNWDSLFFWPSQNYPKNIYGGEVELIKTPGGVWAYVHE